MATADKSEKKAAADVSRIRRRITDMWSRKSRNKPLQDEIAKFIMPYRQAADLIGEGAGRLENVFDSTAIKAGFRFAGRLQKNFTPPFRPFFALEPGPLMPQDDTTKRTTEVLQRIGQVVAGTLANGSFPQRAHEMYYDLYAGNGAMLILDGDDAEPVRFRTISSFEVAIEEGPWGDVWYINWRRKWRLEELPVMWPESRGGKYGAALKLDIDQNPATPIEVDQLTAYDPDARRWVLSVVVNHAGGDQIIYTERTRTCPWLTPRFYVVPGEPYGRGPAHLALPGVKTLNKARELALMAASFAVTGIYTQRNDGVFNPELARFEPLTFWPVASNGGPLGPTIQRLPIPADFDISSVVIADEREQVKQALFDDMMPPLDGAVRSPTEIAGRIELAAEDFGGVAGRLATEIVVKLVQRVIEILENRGVLDTNLSIDQLVTQVRVVSQMALGANADKVKAAVDYWQMLQMLMGPEKALVMLRTSRLAPQIGRWMGLEEEYLPSADEMKAAAAAMMQMAQAEQQAAAPAAKPPTPMDYVNGGMM